MCPYTCAYLVTGSYLGDVYDDVTYVYDDVTYVTYVYDDVTLPGHRQLLGRRLCLSYYRMCSLTIECVLLL